MINAVKKWVVDYEYQWEKKQLSPQDNTTPMIAAKSEQEKELATLTKQLNTAHDLLEQGVYTVTRFADRAKTLNDRITECKESIYKIDEQLSQVNKEAGIIKDFIPKVRSLLDGYDTLKTPAEKNKVLKEIIEKVVYNKEKSAAYKGVAVDDFEIELFVRLPVVSLR